MKRLPKIINQDEFELLYKEVSKSNLKRKDEYKLSMLLGFEAGMRISEILGFENKVPVLISSKIDLGKNSIRIDSGKGGKDRIVPLPKRIKEKQIKLLPLKIKRRALQTFITKLGKRILKKHITFHTLRHGFGSHLAEQGRPLHEIQMLMGHSRLDTTGIYLHTNPKKALDSAREVF